MVTEVSQWEPPEGQDFVPFEDPNPVPDPHLGDDHIEEPDRSSEGGDATDAAAATAVAAEAADAKETGGRQVMAEVKSPEGSPREELPPGGIPHEAEDAPAEPPVEPPPVDPSPTAGAPDADSAASRPLSPSPSDEPSQSQAQPPGAVEPPPLVTATAVSTAAESGVTNDFTKGQRVQYLTIDKVGEAGAGSRCLLRTSVPHAHPAQVWIDAKIVMVGYDEQLVPYFQISLGKDREKSTTGERLRPVPVVAPTASGTAPGPATEVARGGAAEPSEERSKIELQDAAAAEGSAAPIYRPPSPARW